MNHLRRRIKRLLFLRRALFFGVVELILCLHGSATQHAGGPATAAPGKPPFPPLEMVRMTPADELLPFMPRSDFHSETRRNLRWVGLGRQKWLNYSFYNQKRTSLKPDWPISIIFYGNATVEKVKKIYGKYRLSTKKYILYGEEAELAWDSDRGVKKTEWFDGPDGTDRDVLHVRIFAPPAGYFEGEGAWGHYVIATAHFDFNPPIDNSCGYSEDAEHRALGIAERKGYTVFYDRVNLFNGQKFRVRKHYYWQSDGYAGLVYLP
jgi:hypothetical protein